MEKKENELEGVKSLSEIIGNEIKRKRNYSNLKKFLLLAFSFGIGFIIMNDDTHAIDLVTSPTCYQKGICKDDNLGHKWEFKGFNTMGTGTIAYLKLERDGIQQVFTGSFSGVQAPTNSTEIAAVKTRIYFLNNFYGPNSDDIILTVLCQPYYSLGATNSRTFYFIINGTNNTVSQMDVNIQQYAVPMTNATLAGPFSEFQASSNFTQYGGNFIIGALIIGYNSTNNKLYYYSFEDNGTVTLLQTLTPPSGFVAPMTRYGPFEGIISKNCSSCTPHVQYAYIGTDGKLRSFDDTVYQIGTPSTSLIFPMNPLYVLNGEYLTNFNYGTTAVPYQMGRARQLLSSNAYSSVIDGVDQSIFYSGGYVTPASVIKGSKIYFGANVTGSVTTCPNTWTWNSQTSYWCDLSNGGFTIHSYDLACKTPLYNNCRLDVTDGFKYCANDAGSFSPTKEKCDDPAQSANVGNQSQASSNAGPGNLNQQDPSSTYISTTVGGNTIDYQQYNCLYLNPDTERFANPLQFCRVTDFNLGGDEDRFNKICEQAHAGNLYVYGNIKGTKLQMKAGVCATGNSADLVKSYIDPFNGISPYTVNWKEGDSYYGLILDLDTGTNIHDFDLLSNASKFWTSSGGIVKNAVAYGTGLIQSESLINTAKTLSTYTSIGRQFTYFSNEDYYMTCNFALCAYDTANWYVKPKFLYTEGANTTIDGIVASQTVEFIRSNTDGSTQTKEEIENKESQAIFDCDVTSDSIFGSIGKAIACPFNVLKNLFNKASSTVDNSRNFIQQFFSIGTGTGERLFYNFDIFDTAYAGSATGVFGSINSAYHDKVYTDDGNFVHNLWVFFFYGIVTIFFIVIVTIFLTYKK